MSMCDLKPPGSRPPIKMRNERATPDWSKFVPVNEESIQHTNTLFQQRVDVYTSRSVVQQIVLPHVSMLSALINLQVVYAKYPCQLCSLTKYISLLVIKTPLTIVGQSYYILGRRRKRRHQQVPPYTALFARYNLTDSI